jgi:ornithine cyclodeaminase/alanine dehydrogenase-like protein (mu-crystallin family)
VCDSIEQCRLEAGELAGPIQRGVTDWSRIAELADVVSGKTPGRQFADEITLYKAVGLAIQDVVLGAELLRRASEQGIGQPLPF